MEKTRTVMIDRDACIGCGVCVAMCPRRILTIDAEGKAAVTDEMKCDRLAGCERACPVSAIRIGR